MSQILVHTELSDGYWGGPFSYNLKEMESNPFIKLDVSISVNDIAHQVCFHFVFLLSLVSLEMLQIWNSQACACGLQLSTEM